MDDSGQKFIFSEYSALRQEILETLKELPSNEKLGLIFSGAYWAWVLTKPEVKPYLSIAAWVPGMLSILFGLRTQSFLKKLNEFNTYIRKIEEKFDLDELGWEKHIATEKKRKKKSWFTMYNWAFWTALILGNFVTGIVLLSIR